MNDPRLTTSLLSLQNLSHSPQFTLGSLCYCLEMGKVKGPLTDCLQRLKVRRSVASLVVFSYNLLWNVTVTYHNIPLRIRNGSV